MIRSSFCDGWEFARDDGRFAPVVVPHDAMLGNRRGPDAPAASASGYYYGARYRYRKTFTLEEPQVVMIEFEGVYRNPKIMVNGAEIAAPPYGFIPFFVDVSDVVHRGENIIEMQADNSDQPDCRWYSGGGLYRQVWLWEGGTAHIEAEGVKVTTLSLTPAVVRVDVLSTGGTAHVAVIDEAGNVVGEGTGTSCEIAIPNARLWSAEQPSLYTCHVELLHDGRVVDTADSTFGIRTVEWGPEGLFVNGRETLLRGGCIHCDNGVIGAASFPESERRRIRIMKAAGFNAVRVAHNPSPSSLLEACDEIGMYIMEESWDMWFTRKSAHDYASEFLDWCDHDLARIVSHDYNHPSVIMYSIGNEVADPITKSGVAIERSLVELAHSLDPTRPVTAGLNLAMMVMEHAGRGWYSSGSGVSEAAQDGGAPRDSMLFNLAAQAWGSSMTYLANAPGADKIVSPGLDALDIAGYNYAAARYKVDARKHPDRLIVGSETFPHEIDRNWRLVEKLPSVIGDFMWAGWDYLGEAGAGAWAYTAEEAGFSKPWPWLLAGSGAIDLLGQAGAPAALAGAVWGKLVKPSIMVRPVNMMAKKTYRATWRGTDAIPSWSWAGCEGMVAEVEVYDAHAHAVRLELNGEEVSTQPVRRFVAKFKLAYEPGTLRAIALDRDGRELGHSQLVSADSRLHVEARPETRSGKAGGIVYVDVAIRGSNGEVESSCDMQLTATVEDGELLGFGSARPATTERYDSGSFATYRGRAQAIVYRDAPGTATLTIQPAGLESTSVAIDYVSVNASS